MQEKLKNNENCINWLNKQLNEKQILADNTDRFGMSKNLAISGMLSEHKSGLHATTKTMNSMDQPTGLNGLNFTYNTTKHAGSLGNSATNLQHAGLATSRSGNAAGVGAGGGQGTSMGGPTISNLRKSLDSSLNIQNNLKSKHQQSSTPLIRNLTNPKLAPKMDDNLGTPIRNRENIPPVSKSSGIDPKYFSPSVPNANDVSQSSELANNYLGGL